MLPLAFWVAGCPLPQPKAGDVMVEAVQLRMAPAGATTAAVYFTLRNTGQQADTLLQITSPAGAISLHATMVHSDGVVMMTPMARVAIPPKTTIEFKVGERHGMLEKFSRALSLSDSVALTFEFARRKSITVTVRVKAVSTEE